MIEINNVTFAYHETENLKNISISIPKGQVVLLCGESGSGKTTITRLVNGLIPHYFSGKLSGGIKVENLQTKDVNIENLSDMVGSVFQNPRTQFFNSDTDSEIVFGLENQGMAIPDIKERLENITEELNLKNLRGKSIFELSSGEKQKIAFASSYATFPDILVLDEPSSNLDYNAIIDLQNLLKNAKKMGLTILISEHRLWYLMDIIDRVIIMREGLIFGDFTKNDFMSIKPENYKNLGLRCRSLNEIYFENTFISRESSAFDVENISVYLGKEEIVKDVSFKVYRGEVTAITGSNGAGKTTLARALCGLQKFEGSIKIDNESIGRKKLVDLSYMVMQDVGYQLFSESVGGECRLGLRRIEEEKIDETLELMGLTKYKKRHPLSLSGGQKQRLAIAISMICEKKIIVFDEPTSGLDLESMKKVSELILSLAKKGSFVFVITHDNELIASACSRVIRLENGGIINDLKKEEFGVLLKKDDGIVEK